MPAVTGKERAMNLLQPISLGLFDPHLQLEAEAFEGDECRADNSLHAEIMQTIAAIDRLTAQLQPPAEPPHTR
jgi:hypothetical protein